MPNRAGADLRFLRCDDDTMSKERKKGETEMEERKRVNFSPFLGTAEKGALRRFR